jgi:hypothetical protein
MRPDHGVADPGQKHGLEVARARLHPCPFVPLWPRMGLDGAAFGSEQPQVIPFSSYFVILLFVPLVSHYVGYESCSIVWYNACSSNV